MTKQEAEIRLLQVIRPQTLFRVGEMPNNYVECVKQPYLKGFEDYRQCKPVYSQAELDEISQLKKVIEDAEQ